MKLMCVNNKAAFALYLLGLMAIALPLTAGSGEGPDYHRQSEKVNLALRRVAHLLMEEAGDTATRIPPVVFTGDATWQVRLEHAFNYDRLPALLHQSFELHQINTGYDVAVLDCPSGELQLGYNYVDFVEKGEVPCGGRDVQAGCYVIQVTLIESQTSTNSFLFWWLLVGGGLLAGFVYLLKKRPFLPMATAVAEAPVAGESPQIPFGRSALAVQEQTLVAGAVRHSLTYREAKLLRLFATHPNQLLERDVILEQVWQDEGIMVGRSLDVFVSRLRKMLRDDPSVRLVSVHGVGYRLEII
jgi:hypothetical protein